MCNEYPTSFLLLTIYHTIDAMAYIHEGFKARNQGRTMFGGVDSSYSISKMRNKDVIYTNKSRAQGLKELKEQLSGA